jgi:hypothetical protein
MLASSKSQIYAGRDCWNLPVRNGGIRPADFFASQPHQQQRRGGARRLEFQWAGND